MLCQNCGNEIETSVNVCTNCGEVLETPNEKETTKKNSSKKKAAIVISVTAVVLLFVLTIVFLIGGTNKITTEDIQTDLENYAQAQGNLFEAEERIKNIEILEEVEDEERNHTVIRCIVTTEDQEVSYQKQATLHYTYDKKNGTILKLVTLNGENDWTINPIKGVSKDQILNSLLETSITANGEIWHINKENVSVLSITEQETDLENKKDALIISFQIDDVVQQAKGELELEYTFKNEWVLEKMTESDPFEVTAKPGTEIKVNEEVLISALDQKTFTFGVEKINTQKIVINQSELSDFKICSQISSLKGTVITYECTATLTKANANFTLNIEMRYSYGDQWSLSDFKTEARCTSIFVVGVWSGSNVYGRTCELAINAVDTEGNMTGTYSDKGDRFHEPYSYSVSGKIDLNSLLITLKAGTVIGNKPYRAFEPDDINAHIQVEEKTITGNADLKFTVALK